MGDCIFQKHSSYAPSFLGGDIWVFSRLMIHLRYYVSLHRDILNSWRFPRYFSLEKQPAHWQEHPYILHNPIFYIILSKLLCQAYLIIGVSMVVNEEHGD